MKCTNPCKIRTFVQEIKYHMEIDYTYLQDTEMERKMSRKVVEDSKGDLGYTQIDGKGFVRT